MAYNKTGLPKIETRAEEIKYTCKTTASNPNRIKVVYITPDPARCPVPTRKLGESFIDNFFKQKGCEGELYKSEVDYSEPEKIEIDTICYKTKHQKWFTAFDHLLFKVGKPWEL